MSIKFRCPQCNAKIRVGDEHAGKRGECPTCRYRVQIPIPELPDDDEEKKEETRELANVAPASEPSKEEPKEEKPVVEAETSEATDAEDKKEAPKEEAEATPKTEDAKTEEPKTAEATSKFVKFNCPGCGKMTGFPSSQAGTAAKCPACQVSLMIPEASGEESFIVGGMPEDGKQKPVAKPRKRKTGAVATRSTRGPTTTGAGQISAGTRNALILAGGSVLAFLMVVVLILLLRGGDDDNDDTGTNVATAPGGSGTGTATSPRVTPPPEPISQVKKGNGESTEAEKRPPAESPYIPAVGKKTEDEPEKTPEEDPLQIGKSQTTDNGTPGTTDGPEEKKSEEDFLKEKESTTAGKQEEEEEEPEEPKVASTEKPDPGTEPDLPFKVKEPEKEQPEEKKPVEEKPEAIPPPPVCKRCLGTGTVPLPQYRNYIHLENTPPPNPVYAVPWLYCPLCQSKKNQKDLLKDEVNRLKDAMAQHQDWEKRLKIKLLRAETRHVTLHGELPPAMLRQTADALERLVGHLEKVTRTTVLSQARPQTQQILIFWDDAGYNSYIDHLVKMAPGEDFSLIRKAIGSSDNRNLAFFNAKRGQGGHPMHLALHNLSKFLIMSATEERSPHWLTQGFASYCENVITNKNLVYSFRYEMNDVKFGQNWNTDIKKYARRGKLKQWEYIFPLDLVGMSALDYLTCYSMVSFLVKNDPQRFVKFLLEIRDGATSDKALEKVFGRRIKDLQMMWAQWALRQ